MSKICRFVPLLNIKLIWGETKLIMKISWISFQIYSSKKTVDKGYEKLSSNFCNLGRRDEMRDISNGFLCMFFFVASMIFSVLYFVISKNTIHRSLNYEPNKIKLVSLARVQYFFTWPMSPLFFSINSKLRAFRIFMNVSFFPGGCLRLVAVNNLRFLNVFSTTR